MYIRGLHRNLGTGRKVNATRAVDDVDAGRTDERAGAEMTRQQARG